MLVYNVTTKIDWSIADEWPNWMLHEHIPALMHTGCFIKYQLLRLLQNDETDGPTYAAQYYALSHSEYAMYLQKFATEFRRQTLEKWGEKIIAFRTLMEVVN